MTMRIRISFWREQSNYGQMQWVLVTPDSV
jgi:hypothetical protein